MRRMKSDGTIVKTTVEASDAKKIKGNLNNFKTKMMNKLLDSGIDRRFAVDILEETHGFILEASQRIADSMLGYQTSRYDYPDFLRDLVVFNRLENCVEIGVAYGKTTLKLGEAARETGGFVWGFDLWDEHGIYDQYEKKSSLEEVQRLIESSPFDDRICLIKADTRSEKFPNLLKKKCPIIDFAFIDGCHSYYGLKNDFEAVYPLLSSRGIIAFHDTLMIDGCREFMLDLRTKYNDGTFDIVDFPWGGGSRVGVSLLVKRSYPEIKVGIREVCGSPSSMIEIENKEVEWLESERSAKSRGAKKMLSAKLNPDECADKSFVKNLNRKWGE